MLFRSDKTKYTFALIFGIISLLIGLVFTISYIVEAVVERWGEPDQSLIFWYLPILFIGIIFLKLGLGFSIWGFISLRKK